jgi:shikimate dehydrogenase
VHIAGAGGAGRAIAFALAAAGVHELHLVDVVAERAEQVVGALRQAFPALVCSTRDRRLPAVGLAVNASPLGLNADDPSPFDVAALAADAAVFDIVAARETALMRAATARGHAVVGGVAMIRHQIAGQIAFWRGDQLPGDHA